MPSLQDSEPSPLKDLVLGSHALENGDVATAQRLLTRAAASADPTVQADANVRLSSIYVIYGEPRLQAETATTALSLVTEDDEVALAAWSSLASAESALHGAPAGLAVLSQRLPARVADVAGADAELLVVRGVLKMYATHTRAGVEDLRAAIRLARDGSAHHLPAAHVSIWRAGCSSSGIGTRHWCMPGLPRRSPPRTDTAGCEAGPSSCWARWPLHEGSGEMPKNISLPLNRR